MQIHTVQQDETISSIAQRYNIPVERLMRDNELTPGYNLNMGQSLIITYPEQIYIVQEGDTLSSIAQTLGVSFKQMLRNNPFLFDRNTVKPGEELVISYQHKQTIQVNGYAYSHINLKLLSKSLPFLTYLTIINYTVSADGSIIDVNDSELLQLAREYGVAPVMMVSSITEQGKGSYATNHVIFSSQEIQTRLMDNILMILNEKGFYGVNLGFQAILEEDLPSYVNFITNVTNRLNSSGYEVFVTLDPSTFGFINGRNISIPYYEQIGQATNNVILISYQWSTADMSTVAQTTVYFLADYLNYVVQRIPPEKIFLGLSRIAYDWELPYIEGKTMGTALTNVNALNLASQTGAMINYDETTQTPYFTYNTVGVEHFVWFKDARTVNAIIDLVISYGLKGVSIWNIMFYAPQTWLILNTQYEIESVL